jgi:two-component system NtrC family sensor kinase
MSVGGAIRSLSIGKCRIKLLNNININNPLWGINDRMKKTNASIAEENESVVDYMGFGVFAGEESGFTELTDIEAVLDGIIPIVFNDIECKPELSKEYCGLPLVKCHARELGQVFMNILTNAAQAIKDKGQIRIKTHMGADHICVSISDTGCGISPEHTKKIFTPFFTTKEIGKGTGLGLSISYDIIRRHNGDIRVESTNAHGTTFTVELPVQV